MKGEEIRQAKRCLSGGSLGSRLTSHTLTNPESLTQPSALLLLISSYCLSLANILFVEVQRSSYDYGSLSSLH